MPDFRYQRDTRHAAPAPELAVAQWKAVQRQVPLLYAILVANTLILASTHYAIAPFELTVVIPAILACLCLVRTVMFYRGGAQPTDQVRKLIKIHSKASAEAPAESSR